MNRFISLGEVRLGLRLIAKQPILSITIILALATGIGFATMGFTVRDATLNSVLPFSGGERFSQLTAFDRDGGRIQVDLARYHAFLERSEKLEHVGALGSRPFTITHGNGEIESVRGAMITPRSMKVLPAAPTMGRVLIPADAEPGAERVVLLRESLWKRRFDGASSVIGQQVTVGGVPRTVVGVMPDSFEFPSSGELWLPLDDRTLGGNDQSAAEGVRVFGVLKPGVTFDAATVELNGLSQQVSMAERLNQEVRVQARPYTSDSNQAGTAASALVVALLMLLLVVASNVATLVYARTWARAPELAVRTALGASRSRVVGQLFLEALLLGSIAAVLGITGAYSALKYIKGSFEDQGWPFWVTFDPNPEVVTFVVVITILVSAVSGLMPALRVTRHDLRTTLQAGRGFALGGFGKVGASMLIIEIALSVALLNGAVTMARAFNSFVDDIPALPVNQVLTAHLGRIDSREMRDRVTEAALKLPGVSAAGAGALVPRMYPAPRPTAVETLEGETPRAAQAAPSIPVGNGFLEAIGAHPLAGRVFRAADFAAGAAPVAVVNEPFVTKFLGGRNPLGRRIRVDDGRPESAEQPWREIVGVVPDLGMSVGDPALAGGFYTPVKDERLTYLAIRTTADPMTLVSPLRTAVANIDPDLQLEEILPLEEAGKDERVFLAGIAMALTAMGGMALALSVVGIYALLSFMVTRRTREIGIRVALGAQSRQVLRSITGGALVYLAVGGLLGSGLGVVFIQLRSMILISIPAPGFWMPATIFLTLAVAGISACWVPARRALGIRPSEALSAD
jgi:putative ABC transport system permease protein